MRASPHGKCFITKYPFEVWSALVQLSALPCIIAGMNRPLFFSDRRTHARIRVCKPAKIVFNARASVLDCTVRNISDTGACLVLAAPAVLPTRWPR